MLPAHNAKPKVTYSTESTKTSVFVLSVTSSFACFFAAFWLIFSFNCTLLSFSSPLTLWFGLLFHLTLEQDAACCYCPVHFHTLWAITASLWKHCPAAQRFISDHLKFFLVFSWLLSAICPSSFYHTEKFELANFAQMFGMVNCK